MYSKEDSQKIKKEFWIEFAEKYPKKWILYNTKIKDVSFKFYIDNKKAQVQLDIEPKDQLKRKIYFEKIQSLQNILKTEYLPDIFIEKDIYLENGKIISRIWVEKINVSINNKNSWHVVYHFFNEKMMAFEFFFYEYQEYIMDLETNI
jgi:hypothetical protein